MNVDGELLDGVGIFGFLIAAFPSLVRIDALDDEYPEFTADMPPVQARALAHHLLDMASRADPTGEHGVQLCTMAQLARRVGLSDGRVRAMWAADRPSLPTPDAWDIDGHPLWLPDLIDNW